MKSQIRHPKGEIRKKPEARSRKTAALNVARSRSAELHSISLWPNRRRPSESLVLVVVLVLVIGDGAVENEDEKEDEDDLFAAPAHSAVSQIRDLRYEASRWPRARECPDGSPGVRASGAPRYPHFGLRILRFCQI
jgi:hypothetical protein